MAKDIEPKLKTICEFLTLKNNEIFEIPEYQRGYSWSINQCEKLFQDIKDFIDSDSLDPYFFGTIIIDCSDSNKLSLIDGQQRTTTFLLLLKALLIALNDTIAIIPNNEDSEILKAGLEENRDTIISLLYKANRAKGEVRALLRDNSKMKGVTILENNSINEQYPYELVKIIESEDLTTAEKIVHTIPRKQKDNKYTNHFRNFKYFFDRFKLKDSTQLNIFAEKLLHNCQIIEIRSWQVEQAITMFNSLNSAGMPLSDADIISAQLYSNSNSNKDSKKDFEIIWKEITDLADQLNLQKISNIDSILQQFMYINRSLNKEYISKKDDGSLSVNVTTLGLRRYYTEKEKELLKSPMSLCHNLSKIVNTWDLVKDYPIVKLLLKCNENIKLFLSSYLYRYDIEEITENKILDVCECLLRLFTLLEIGDLGYSSSKFKTFLFEQNINFVDTNITTEEIKNKFNEHIQKNWNPEVVKSLIQEYEKHFLVYINEYIYSKNKGVKFDFTNSVNVEHIMPASGGNIESIQYDAEIKDSEEFNEFVNKIGNKILLEEKINQSIGNNWFRTKKQSTVKKKTGYKDSNYAIAQALTSYPKEMWTKTDIEEATEKATNRIINFIFSK